MTNNLPLPPKPPVPSTNLLPAIIIVAVVAVASLAMALWLPAPRRPAPAATQATAPVQALPPLAAAPITEYEETAPATLPTPTTLPKPKAASPTVVTPRWQTNAQPEPAVPAGFARLAIVIDDMGVDVSNTVTAMGILPPTVTFAYLPYAPDTRTLAHQAYARGHEILVHLPMEPLARASDTTPNPGPHALTVEQSQPTIAANLARHLKGLEDIAVGANNHMGSRFTQWPEGMHTVLARLQDDGLMFLDSVTTARTATRDASQGLTLPLLRRDVFLDDQPDPAIVQSQLERAIAMARRNGSAIAIGHPHPSTLAVLAERLPQLEAEHVTLVPLTALISQP